MHVPLLYSNVRMALDVIVKNLFWGLLPKLYEDILDLITRPPLKM